MRRLRAALAACALAAAPAALAAQQTQPPPVHPHPPITHPVHPHPTPSGAYANHNHGRNGNPYGAGYPLVIDGSALNRILATPSPKPKHTPAAALTAHGEQVFETHSTDDNR